MEMRRRYTLEEWLTEKVPNMMTPTPNTTFLLGGVSIMQILVDNVRAYLDGGGREVGAFMAHEVAALMAELAELMAEEAAQTGRAPELLRATLRFAEQMKKQQEDIESWKD